MLFAGTTVVNGHCVCLVTHTGMETEIWKVHKQVHVAALSEEETPLKKKLNEFGELLTLIIGVVCALVWLINVKYFLTWEYAGGWPRNLRFSFEKCTYYFEIAVALAVAAIPEGLPAVITASLALGTRKMAQKNALVRKLTSVETLGCTTVICPSREEADKTVNAFHNKKTLPGASSPIQVKHADGEVERLEHKLFIGMLPKNISEVEVSALFSKYGTVKDLQILRGSQQTSKGAFLKYESKEQALAALEAINRKHTMEDSGPSGSIQQQNPVGHGKFETLGAFGISCMLLATEGGIAWHTLDILMGLFSSGPEMVSQALAHEHVHSHGHVGHHYGIDMDHPILALNMT